LNKKSSDKTNKKSTLNITSEKELNSKLNNKNLSSFKTLLKSKIQIVKNSLSNNKLAFPLNLLDPIIYTPRFMDKINKVGITSSKLIDFNKGILSGRTGRKILEFKQNIANYNLNNLNQISNTKYLQLISPFKVVNEFQQNIRYNFSKNKYSNIKIENIITLLEYAFRSMSCLISKPVFLETPNKLIINLFYFFVPGKINTAKKTKRIKRLGLFDVNNINIKLIKLFELTKLIQIKFI